MHSHPYCSDLRTVDIILPKIVPFVVWFRLVAEWVRLQVRVVVVVRAVVVVVACYSRCRCRPLDEELGGLRRARVRLSRVRDHRACA